MALEIRMEACNHQRDVCAERGRHIGLDLLDAWRIYPWRQPEHDTAQVKVWRAEEAQRPRRKYRAVLRVVSVVRH